MTDPCTPPPGTADGTWHFLMHSAGVTMQAHWSHGIWRPLDSDWGYTENRYGELGWRYVGPVCPVCQGHGTAAATSAALPPPDPRDALLEDISTWAGHLIHCAVWDTNARTAHEPIKCTCGMDSIIARIRASLKGE